MGNYLCIDAGTSIIKVVVFDHNFKIKFKSSSPNKIITDNTGKSEIDMNLFWEITSKLIKKVLQNSNFNSQNIISVGITGNMVGVWPINANGAPTRNAILWNDARSKSIFDSIKKSNSKIYENIFELSGSIVQFGCTIPVIKWLEKNEKSKLTRTKYFLTCKDWLRFKLTNTINNDFTERAVGPGNIYTGVLSEKIFKLLKLDKKNFKKFPDVKNSDEIAGNITKSASSKTGIKEGTPVIIGAGDVPATAIGVGAIKNGITSTIIGTTCHNYLVCNKPMFKPKNTGLLFYTPNRQWLRTMINVAGTTNFDWVIENFYKDQLLTKDKIQIIKDFEKSSNLESIRNSDLIFLPYLNYGGSISPFFNLNTKAEIFGLLPHHTRHDILLSAYEGLAFSIRDCYESLKIKLNTLHLSGGGSSSKILPQIISDILKVKVAIPEGSEFGAKGVAYLSAIALGKYKSYEDVISKNHKIKEIFLPNKDLKSYYDQKYLKYLSLRKALEKIW
jgi:sugar (pentulose or hexulose) kinase